MGNFSDLMETRLYTSGNGGEQRDGLGYRYFSFDGAPPELSEVQVWLRGQGGTLTRAVFIAHVPPNGYGAMTMPAEGISLVVTGILVQVTTRDIRLYSEARATLLRTARNSVLWVDKHTPTVCD